MAEAGAYRFDMHTRDRDGSDRQRHLRQRDRRARGERTRLFLDGRCSALTADVGIDDEREPAQQRGSAAFEIWADGAKAAASGVRTWQDPAVTLSAELTGARFLRLVVTDGGDGNAYDRGDWAAPRLTCQ